jgi:hypothetical protein
MLINGEFCLESYQITADATPKKKVPTLLSCFFHQFEREFDVYTP